MPPPHEDRVVLAVWLPSMEAAVAGINATRTAYLLREVVPARGEGYWLVYKGDSWVREQWLSAFPHVKIIPATAS